MTHASRTSRIAASTGEPGSVISRLGIPLQAQPHDERNTDDLIGLVVRCPHCARPVNFPGLSRDGSNPMAECENCDVYFHFEDHDVIPADARRDARDGHPGSRSGTAVGQFPASAEDTGADRHPIGGDPAHDHPCRERTTTTRQAPSSARDPTLTHHGSRDPAVRHTLPIAPEHAGAMSRRPASRPSALRRGWPPVTRSMAPSAPPSAPGSPPRSLPPGVRRFAAAVSTALRGNLTISWSSRSMKSSITPRRPHFDAPRTIGPPTSASLKLAEVPASGTPEPLLGLRAAPVA